MKKKQSISIKLEKVEQQILSNNFSQVRKGLKGFFKIRHDAKLGLIGEVTFILGREETTSSGAILVEIKRPRIKTFYNSSAALKVNNLIWYLMRQAKTELVKNDCQFYEDCLEIAGDCPENDYSFLKRTKGGWWGFSCMKCPFNI